MLYRRPGVENVAALKLETGEVVCEVTAMTELDDLSWRVSLRILRRR